MNELHDLLTQVVALNEGKRIVGKTRLQKTVFLLDQCGLGSGSRYDYHYFGPFSSEIADAAEDACELGRLRYNEKPGFHAVPYGIYDLAQKDLVIPQRIGSLHHKTIKEKLEVMNSYSAIELELAATIQYLNMLCHTNAIEEVKELKPAKATPNRLSRAKALLHELGLVF